MFGVHNKESRATSINIPNNPLIPAENVKNFMAPFYGWGSTTSRLEPLRGGSLLFTTNSQKFLVLTLLTSEG